MFQSFILQLVDVSTNADNHEIYSINIEYSTLNQYKKNITFESLVDFVEEYEQIMLKTVKCERNIIEMKRSIEQIKNKIKEKED